jgi:hypothetical protein
MKKIIGFLIILITITSCNSDSGDDGSTYELVKENITLDIDATDPSNLIISAAQDTLDSFIEEYVANHPDKNLAIETANPNKVSMAAASKVSMTAASITPMVSEILSENHESVMLDRSKTFQGSVSEVTGNTLDLAKYFNQSEKQFTYNKENDEFEFATRERVQPFVNEALPLQYVQRSFLKNPAALSYDIYRLPGRFVEKNDSGTYELVTIVSTLKKTPEQIKMDNEILYCNKINNAAAFNGKALIGGVSVENERMMELIIQDIAKAVLSADSLLNDEKFKRTLKAIPPDRRKNIYFIEGAVLTVVNYRKFNKTKFKASLNTSWVTAEGNAFSSDESFRKERLVGLDLVKIDKLIQ